MFRSVFAKYVWGFIVLILLSFALIITVITGIVINYSQESKTTTIENVAVASSEYLRAKMEKVEDGRLGTLVSLDGDDLSATLAIASSDGDDITVLLADREGRMLLGEGPKKSEISRGAFLPATVMDQINSGAAISRVVRLEGVFKSATMIYALPVYNEGGVVCGTVLVCTSSVILTELLSKIVNAIVMSILWVMLAALIAVYFISEKITAPLKEISLAARQFAKGKFDTRVSVSGSDEVAELASAFNHMATSLDNYENMRNTFISNVSHDLRTPMTSISGFVDGILDGVIPPDKQEYYLRIVSSEVKRLSRLVTSLLDLSRIQAGERKFTFAPFNVCEMARQILISFESAIEEKRFEVEFECDEDDITVVADRDAIYQILYNLCDNAVKFANVGGVLSIGIKKQKGHRVCVSVYNEGQGILPEDLPNVFERFYKSDKSRGLNKTGVGLGLYISKTIIDAHDENIWVESEYGKNCCFYFTLKTE